MAKKKKKNGPRREKSEPKTSRDLRELAEEIERIPRYIRNACDDMDGASIETIKPILQGIKSLAEQLQDRIDVEIVNRVYAAVRKKAREDADRFG